MPGSKIVECVEVRIVHREKLLRVRASLDSGEVLRGAGPLRLPDAGVGIFCGADGVATVLGESLLIRTPPCRQVNSELDDSHRDKSLLLEDVNPVADCSHLKALGHIAYLSVVTLHAGCHEGAAGHSFLPQLAEAEGIAENFEKSGHGPFCADYIDGLGNANGLGQNGGGLESHGHDGPCGSGPPRPGIYLGHRFLPLLGTVLQPRHELTVVFLPGVVLDSRPHVLAADNAGNINNGLTEGNVVDSVVEMIRDDRKFQEKR